MHPELGFVVAIFFGNHFFYWEVCFLGGLFWFVEEKWREN